MSVTLEEARSHLRIEGTDELGNLLLYVDAANAWVTEKVTDTAPEVLTTLATLLLIQHWWETSQLGRLDQTSHDYADIEGRTYAIPNKVRELIDGFLTSSTPLSPSGEFPTAVAWPDPVEWPA